MKIRAATRASALALWQTDHVARLVREVGHRIGVDVVIEPVVVETNADRRLEIPIWEMGGKGVFVKEVQAALLDGRADIAVHSCKDLPTASPDGIILACIPERGDSRDVLVGSTLRDLPTGAVVATGSVRRRAQMASLRTDLSFTGLRGNIATRLERAHQYGAILVAYAALERLGLEDRATEVLEPSVMVPQVGQGALAIECRRDDGSIRDLLAQVEHRESRMAVDAERSFLAELGGGCDLPTGAHAVVHGEASMSLEGILASMDGHVVMRHSESGTDPLAVGKTAARFLLDNGGSALLRG